MKLALKLLLVLILLSCKSNTDNDNSTSNEGDEEYIVTDNTRSEDQDQKSESYKRGKDLYNDFCITCHLATGEGVSGAFPPLDGSDWLTKKRTESISAVKHGLKGPITVNGVEYNSAMADLGLTDKEVADVMNYINNSWSNKIKKPVTEEEVAKIEN